MDGLIRFPEDCRPSRSAALYVFGDSYSDTGAGYVDGDGPTAVGYLAPVSASRSDVPQRIRRNSQSLNFAVSGAQTGRGAGRKVKDAFLGRGMVEQVDDFAARVESKQVMFDPAGTLFFLAGGLNDRRLPSAETVANLKGQIRKLYSLGARRFRLALLPTAIPSFSEVGIRLNPELQRIPGEIEAELPGAQIQISNWGLFFDEVMRNPSAYGIENTKDACAGRSHFQRGYDSVRQTVGLLLLPRRAPVHRGPQGGRRQDVRGGHDRAVKAKLSSREPG